jgi:acetoin utilization protein AcuB
MSKPTISRYMTRDPWTIGPEERIATAYEVMASHTVRHLPVVERGEVVGIVSQRDLFFLEGLRRIDPEVGKVEAAMTPEPYAVPPEAPVDEVARRMAESRFGAALVVKEGKLLGIFTTMDALRALTDVIGSQQGDAP